MPAREPHRWRVWRVGYASDGHGLGSCAPTPEGAVRDVASRYENKHEKISLDRLVARDLQHGTTYDCVYVPEEKRAYVMREIPGWSTPKERRMKPTRSPIPAQPGGMYSTIPAGAAPGLFAQRKLRIASIGKRTRGTG